MTNKDIVEILKMRMAVYTAGIQAGEWKDLDTLGASDMMDYLFPKSGKLAFYQLLMEQMRTAHDILTGGVYYLFKMPVQVEKEISEYLKKEETDIKTLVDDAEGYLASMDTIPTRSPYLPRPESRKGQAKLLPDGNLRPGSQALYEDKDYIYEKGCPGMTYI